VGTIIYTREIMSVSMFTFGPYARCCWLCSPCEHGGGNRKADPVEVEIRSLVGLVHSDFEDSIGPDIN
jgi:hypothetical protein